MIRAPQLAVTPGPTARVAHVASSQLTTPQRKVGGGDVDGGGDDGDGNGGGEGEGKGEEEGEGEGKAAAAASKEAATSGWSLGSYSPSAMRRPRRRL